MKKLWFTLPVLAGAVVLFVAAAPNDDPKAPAFKSPAKAGLWVIERHSNIAIFVAPPKDPAAMAARSEEVMKMPARARQICVSEDLRQKLAGQMAGMEDCTFQPPKAADGVATTDGICKGKNYHLTTTFGAADHIMTGMHLVSDDPADPDGGGTTDVRYEPEHILITTTLNRQYNGVHMIDVWDLHWLAADCGDLKSGQAKPLNEKPETVH